MGFASLEGMPSTIQVACGSETAAVRPTIFHDVRHEPALGLGDPEGAMAEIEHWFSIVVERSLLRSHLKAEDAAGRKLWRHLRTLLCGDPTLFEQYRRGRFLVARLGIGEFPVHIDDEYFRDWSAWLDEIDAEAGMVGHVAYKLTSPKFTDTHNITPLTDGSLFIIRQLEVHPACRGQQVGVRLILHALAELSRSPGDTAVGLVQPIQTVFDAAKPARAAEDVRILMSYYEKIGFKRWKPRKRLEDGEPGMMYACFGELGLDVARIATREMTKSHEVR